ncbi:mucoidy inhibitor MuiA family protein [Candidatus Chlorohelix sp.]|uniref:mucoidy inhibitor MuiA family protein n=1 Tax=Candidatus Chlorohelix sp. TaxID=3139201 RepID=UPI003051D0C3
MSESNETIESIKTVETHIAEVTVYTSQALVTRRGKVSLSGSEKELVVNDLPSTIQTESFRAGGVGTVAVRLLGVRSEYAYTTEPVGEKLAELTRRLEELETLKQETKSKLDTLKMQRSFVENLSQHTVEEFSKGLARNRVGLEEVRNLLDFIGEQRIGYEATLQKEELAIRELDKQIEVVRAEIKRISIPRARESYKLAVSIEATGAGEFELEVSYMISRAGWTPLYDLRVRNAGDKVNLSYLAEVQQSSGEEWQGVRLTLSTAKPALGTLPPRLNPWYLDSYRPSPPRTFHAMSPQAMVMAAPAPSQFSDETTGAFAELAESLPEYKAASVSAEVSSEGGVVTFRLERDSNIPSDGAPHKTTIFNEDFPARVEYITIPKLVSFAYIQATVTNRAGGVTLLPGKANIFRENTFVGTTMLENIAPGQEFKLNLGIDEGLKIERELVEREVDKKFIGGQRRTTFGYRITVTSLREQETTLRLTEQIPVSRNEQIKVRLIKATPQIQPGEMGVLEWVLALQPQAKREVSYQFTVEHPTDLNVTGLSV